MRKGILVGVAALLAVSAIAHAGTIAAPTGATPIFSDDFESYADDAAFKAAWNGTTGGLPTLQPAGKGGGNAVMNGGGAVVCKNLDKQYLLSDLTGNKALVLEFDMWDYDNNAGANSARNTLSLRDLGGSSLITEFGEYNGYQYRTVYFGANDGYHMLAPLAEESWGTDPNLYYHHWKAIITSTKVDVTLTYGNGTVKHSTTTIAPVAGKNIQSVRIGGPSGNASCDVTMFDNVQLYTTPEPASMLLLGLGGLLLRRRRA